MTPFQEALLSVWHPADPFRPTEEALRYYEVKYQIAKRLQPASICEIGVRAGYSAFAFLSACPNAHYLGVDIGTDGAEDVNEASMLTAHVAKILHNFDYEIWWVNSQSIVNMPWAHYDLFHIDADHSYVGCRGDLRLAVRSKPRYILVDDFDVGPEVRAACRDFLLHPLGQVWRAEYIPDGFRGNLLLSRR